MKVILDEGVPRQLVTFLAEHAVETVPEVGWAGVKNGRLLSLIEASGYQCFVTCDKNIPLQQGRLERWPFAILVLSTNHFPTMSCRLEAIRSALNYAEPGAVTDVDCGMFIPKRLR